MTLPLSSLTLRRPASLDEALRMMRDERLAPLAGCTDVYVGLHFGREERRGFIDIRSLDALRGIRLDGDTVRIGAATTCAELLRSDVVRERLPALVAAAREIGGAQIQNRGTLGGNIANASPAGDTLPVLAVAEAVLVLRSADGERRVPITAFPTGYRATSLRPDELIVAVEVPPVDGAQWFRKVGTRAAQAISKVVMAAVRAPAPRIAFGSVAATVVRVPETEACLAAGGSIDDAVRILDGEIRPIDDVRSTAEYRRRVAGNLLRQWWAATEPDATTTPA